MTPYRHHHHNPHPAQQWLDPLNCHWRNCSGSRGTFSIGWKYWGLWWDYCAEERNTVAIDLKNCSRSRGTVCSFEENNTRDPSVWRFVLKEENWISNNRTGTAMWEKNRNLMWKPSPPCWRPPSPPVAPFFPLKTFHLILHTQCIAMYHHHWCIHPLNFLFPLVSSGNPSHRQQNRPPSGRHQPP